MHTSGGASGRAAAADAAGGGDGCGCDWAAAATGPRLRLGCDWAAVAVCVLESGTKKTGRFRTRLFDTPARGRRVQRLAHDMRASMKSTRGDTQRRSVERAPTAAMSPRALSCFPDGLRARLAVMTPAHGQRVRAHAPSSGGQLLAVHCAVTGMQCSRP